MTDTRGTHDQPLLVSAFRLQTGMVRQQGTPDRMAVVALTIEARDGTTAPMGPIEDYHFMIERSSAQDLAARILALTVE